MTIVSVSLESHKLRIYHYNLQQIKVYNSRHVYLLLKIQIIVAFTIAILVSCILIYIQVFVNIVEYYIYRFCSAKLESVWLHKPLHSMKVIFIETDIWNYSEVSWNPRIGYLITVQIWIESYLTLLWSCLDLKVL